ncbi:xanthine dehydrogenase family protein molybdopterin-binding subunit [Photobacterium sp. TLY01]|uniref:xanthine dehydrogenase family protein molybdopterin-binding subunit n=1 Tax=Photobacterium sp. TLY01 TaxID=2907534 RepID=UPI001F422D15|nr:molybdopterin cofactor-binding domain-containing protein [Photobacterium sp. TLY01]UIP28786.1 molybdopterin-dependent oxidoreductase [Photobacterium sp. TLY01]
MLLSSVHASENNQIEKFRANWKKDNKPHFRFDAIEKVTGQKIYGRDYRAVDMPGWPDEQHHALIIRASIANRVYQGFDISFLPSDMQPYKVITAEDLKAHHIDWIEEFGGNMLLEKGRTPDYLGHEIAVLLFDSFDAFNKAKNRIQFNKDVVQYGEKTPLVAASRDPYASWRIIREQGLSGQNDRYSALQDGLFFPDYVKHRPVWPDAENSPDDNGKRGMFYAQQLHNDMADQDEWFVLNRTYHTQSIEPMAFEPESYNGWYDKTSKTMHIVISSQSAQHFYYEAGKAIAKSSLASDIQNVVVHTPYIGGGFGSKDHTHFPYYGILASLFAKAPVRLANDRFEQFQYGLKRHPFKMVNQLAFDKKTKKIAGLVSDMEVDGGGRINFSPSVTMVGASALQGIYYIPRNDIAAVCYPSQTPHAGSMRGYGTLQSMSAMEMMLNEAAAELDIDPIELRKINALRPGERNTQGARPNGDMRYVEMLELAEKHPTWVNRQSAKKAFEAKNPGKLYGVGFGIVSKDYGTGAAAPSSSVELTPEGKIIVKTCSVEMGTGIDTSQGSLVSKYLGTVADEVQMAVTEEFDAMELFATDNPYITSQERQDQMSKNPRWTPVVSMSTAASMSSFYQAQTTENAARILFEHSLFPAAVEIWKKRYFNGELATPDFIDITEAHWNKDGLTIKGYPPIDLVTLAKKAHLDGMITAVMTHAFNRWAWATAEFEINGETKRYPLDAIAVKRGIGARNVATNRFGYQVIERKSVDYPSTQLNNAMVTYYAPCATLAEISVEKASGNVEILSTHTWLEPGKVLVEQLVEGQVEGGLTMGVGHALYEYLPNDENGAGNGTWNLNRYQVPLAKHNGVWHLTHTMLPPLSESDPAKGIAEVVMIPVVPALIEAIYQATHIRFYHTPVRPQDIIEAMKS